LPRDARRRDPEPLRELGAAQLAVGCDPELAQDCEVREGEPMGRERVVDVARQLVAGEQDVEDEVERRGDPPTLSTTGH
jgi:hypothetical protein